MYVLPRLHIFLYLSPCGWSTTTRSPPRRGAAHHIPPHQVGGPPPILGGIDRRGGARGDGGVEDFCGRGEEEFARGKRPGGAVLFKNSERMFWKSESEMSADLLFVFE